MAKKLDVLILCGVLLFCLASCGQSNEDYTENLISILNRQENSKVKDIFSFDFDRAYVFNLEDSYLNGTGFAKNYNLDISISQVGAGESDCIQRIVFVDESGKFVYLFKCSTEEIYIESKGVVIYPDTIINQTSSGEVPLTILFENSEQYSS